LFELGAAFAVVAYGTEAQSVMRIEKGHIAGPELNGQTTAADLGLRRMMLNKKKDFIGRVLAQRAGFASSDRPTLTGLRPVQLTDRLAAGAHLMPLGVPASPANNQGWVSSATYSPTLGHWIALAFIKHGRERYGERLRVYDAVRGNEPEVQICSPVFVDPEGARARG
jgi:sarcosine oxidase subunit alpha